MIKEDIERNLFFRIFKKRIPRNHYGAFGNTITKIIKSINEEGDNDTKKEFDKDILNFNTKMQDNHLDIFIDDYGYINFESEQDKVIFNLKYL